MMATKKVNKDTVAVLSFGAYPVSIALRKSGKAYYGTEKNAVRFEEDKLVINRKVLSQHGLSLEIET